MDDFVKNMKCSHEFDKMWIHNQMFFCASMYESKCLFRNGIKKIRVGFIFLTIPRSGKRRSCISELFPENAYTKVCFSSFNA